MSDFLQSTAYSLQSRRPCGTPLIYQSDANAPGGTNTQVWLWEAQTTVQNVNRGRLNAINLQQRQSHNFITWQLTNSVGNTEEFAHIGTLSGLSVREVVDLKGIALLTGMTSNDLQTLVTSRWITNSVPDGAQPAVKAVAIGGSTYWYVAPQDVSIAIPDKGTMIYVR